MADTLKRVFGPANIASGYSAVFTGTAAHVYTIKNIVIVNPTSAAITVKLAIEATSGSQADSELILPTATIDAGGMAEFDGLCILTGTEVLTATASATGLTITAHGLDQG